MEIKILSEHKKIPKLYPVKKGFKRVMAAVKIGGEIFTKHLDIPKDQK